MARQAKNNVNKFKGLEDSPAIQGIEKIYEANEEARQKRVAEAMEKQQKEELGEQQEEQRKEQQTKQATIEADPAPQAAAPSPFPVPSPVPSVAAPVAPTSEPVARKASKKTQNGITIYVPMDYYMQILQMKMETGTPIKDIALQAVIEYLDRHKND